jgi:transposase
MGYIRGKPLEPRFKQAIVSVKKFFDRNKNEIMLSENSVQLTADVLEVGVSTVKRIMAEFNRDPTLLDKVPESKGRPDYAIDSTHEEAIRNYIRTANKNGEYITISTLSDFIKKKDPNSNSFHHSTLSRTLDRWGFEFGKGKRTQHLKEKDYIIALRQTYLRRMKLNRDKNGNPIRSEIYLDESYVNKNHSNDFIWYSGEDDSWVQKPTGKGERLIIVNAISSQGWVKGAKLVFQAKRKTGDYHGQMNTKIFKKWLTEMLIPNIPDHSLIIMDNAPYHNTLSKNSPPTATCGKEKILTWLLQHQIPCEKDCLKAELVTILQKLTLTPIYEMDDIAMGYGHDIIRTPPYHPELQPIELCWGIVKNHIARNCNFTLSNLKIQLENGFEKVTPSTCEKIVRKIKKKEEQFWMEDMLFDPSE